MKILKTLLLNHGNSDLIHNNSDADNVKGGDPSG